MVVRRGAQEHLCSQRIQLRLALVVLGKVSILQSGTRVRFVDADRQRTSEVLHCEVLPQGLDGNKHQQVARRPHPCLQHRLLGFALPLSPEQNIPQDLDDALVGSAP